MFAIIFKKLYLFFQMDIFGPLAEKSGHHCWLISAWIIQPRFFADVLYYGMLWQLLSSLLAGLSTHACYTDSHVLSNRHYVNYSCYAHMQLAHGIRGQFLSANLKRKRRSWWGAAGPVQRRPVEGCRAEKILGSKQNMEEKYKKETGRTDKHMNHD